jgi:hypothetical protein
LIFSVRKAGYFFRSAEHAALYASCWYLFSVPGNSKLCFLAWALMVCGNNSVTSQFSSNWNTPSILNEIVLHLVEQKFL